MCAVYKDSYSSFSENNHSHIEFRIDITRGASLTVSRYAVIHTNHIDARVPTRHDRVIRHGCYDTRDHHDGVMYRATIIIPHTHTLVNMYTLQHAKQSQNSNFQG